MYVNPEALGYYEFNKLKFKPFENEIIKPKYFQEYEK